MKNDNQGIEGDQGSASEARVTGSGGSGRGNAANLSHEARVKGGQRSAQVQVRDEHGQFAGRKGGESKSRSREDQEGMSPREEQNTSGGQGGGSDQNSPRSEQ